MYEDIVLGALGLIELNNKKEIWQHIAIEN